MHDICSSSYKRVFVFFPTYTTRIYYTYIWYIISDVNWRPTEWKSPTLIWIPFNQVSVLCSIAVWNTACAFFHPKASERIGYLFCRVTNTPTYVTGGGVHGPMAAYLSYIQSSTVNSLDAADFCPSIFWQNSASLHAFENNHDESGEVVAHANYPIYHLLRLNERQDASLLCKSDVVKLGQLYLHCHRTRALSAPSALDPSLRIPGPNFYWQVYAYGDNFY